MPRQAYVYIAVILIFGALGVPLAATHLKYEKAAANALVKVKGSNEKNAETLETQQDNLDSVKAELTQAALGWDDVWDDVDVRVDQGRGQLTLNIGTNNGVDVVNGRLPVLHGFTTIENELRYVGPFQAVSPPGPDSVTVKPIWTVFRKANGIDPTRWGLESNDWRSGKWKFRSLIPGADKRRFEGLAFRAQTATTRFLELQQSVQSQQKLLDQALIQAEQRLEELLGTKDPNVEEDPLRPELKFGLNKALEDEEEARNALALEIDALRRAILEQKDRKDQYQQQLKGAGTAAVPETPRLGSLPRN